MDFVPFQRVLEPDDVDAVQAYLTAADQATANELLRLAGERYGFLTVDIGGVRYMLPADLAQRLYRSSDTASLAQLLKRYGEPLMSLRSAVYDPRHSLPQAFDLPPKSVCTLFATYRHYVIACLKNQTPTGARLSGTNLQGIVYEPNPEKLPGHWTLTDHTTT
jgi:hypothetical protein